MALKIKFKDTEFGVGDKVRVVQRIKDGEKTREASFEGMVLGIKGREPGKTFTVRRIAEGGIGVERIFPMTLPSIDKVIVVKRGTEGVKRAKLYYTRAKSTTEVDMIFKRAAIKGSVKESKKPANMLKFANINIKSDSKKKTK